MARSHTADSWSDNSLACSVFDLALQYDRARQTDDDEAIKQAYVRYRAAMKEFVSNAILSYKNRKRKEDEKHIRNAKNRMDRLRRELYLGSKQ